MSTRAPADSQLRACWIAPDDRGGGVISVVEACCRQATQRGIDATMLLLLPPTGHAAEYASFSIESLQAAAPFADAPARLMTWLEANPQDALLFNGCDQFDALLPHVPADSHAIYCVHDTAPRYFSAAVRHQDSLDAIVAVSEAVAKLIRPQLRRPGMLHVVHNGTILPMSEADAEAAARKDDLIFMGGSNPVKGSADVLKLWAALETRGFAGRLHWFGKLTPELEAKIARAAGSGRIELHGRRPRSEVFAAAAQCRVMLMLSRVEPFGMATIEAMGMGCLPVAWDIETGTTEIVAPEFRFFAPLGEFEVLADRVLDACRRHDALFRASMRDVRTRFDESVMGGRYAGLIELLRQNPPVARPLAGTPPPAYRPPVRYYQFLPAPARAAIRNLVGRWPALGHAVRDLRGL